MVSLAGAQSWPQAPKAIAQTCSVKKVFLEIWQNALENTCARASFLIKLQASATLLKKRPWHRCFSWEFCEISKNSFFYRTPLVVAPETRPLGAEWHKVFKIIHCGISPTG